MRNTTRGKADDGVGMRLPDANIDNGIQENATGGTEVTQSKLSRSHTPRYKERQPRNVCGGSIEKNTIFENAWSTAVDPHAKNNKTDRLCRMRQQQPRVT